MPLNPLGAGPGTIVQSVASQTSDPGVGSLIPAQPHSFVGIDHEIFLSPFSFRWFKKGCCQLQVKVCAWGTG